MTLTDLKAHIGLIAGATPAGTNVANNVQIGQGSTTLSWATTDALAYSFSVTGTDTQVATLTLGTGAVTGTATPTDNDADFEGIALPAMVTLYGVLVECTTAPATSITVAGTAGLAGVLYVAEDRILIGYKTGNTALGTVTITFSGASGVAEVTVIGKTT